MSISKEPGLENKYLTVDYNFSSEIMLQCWVWCGNLPCACAVQPETQSPVFILRSVAAGSGVFFALSIIDKTHKNIITQLKHRRILFDMAESKYPMS